MKHLLVTFFASVAALLYASTAFAVAPDPDLSLSAQAEAISSELKTGSEDDYLSARLVETLTVLRTTAETYAAREDKGKLPEDLRCIFRGIATETRDQLQAKTSRDPSIRAKAHDRLTTMLRDAHELGLEAELIVAERLDAAPESINTADDALAFGTCEGAPEPYDPNLIEQP